jgi:hypothetical protein
VLVASVAFVLLTGSSRSGELKVKGSVESNFRPAYDVLVRPKDSATPIERAQGLVRDNYLSGIFGGITLKQWHAIEKLRGVSVAAPVANLGYVKAFTNLPVSIDRFVTSAPEQLFRLRVSYVTPDGSRYPASTAYVYLTRTGRFVGAPVRSKQLDHGELLDPCGGFTVPASPLGSKPIVSGFKGPFDAELFPYITCISTSTGRPEQLGRFPSPYVAHVGPVISAYFPILLSAIDPVQEAKLVHLDRTVVSGRYLRSREQPQTKSSVGLLTHTRLGNRFVPILAATKTFVGDRLDAQVQRLSVPVGLDAARALSTGSCSVAVYPCPKGEIVQPTPGSAYRDGLGFARTLPATPVGDIQIGFTSIYDTLLAGSAPGFKNSIAAQEYWAVSDVHYRRDADGALVPTAVTNPNSVYFSNYGVNGSGVAPLPLDNEDVQFRKLSERVANNDYVGGILNTPDLRVVGRFDPSKLPGFSPLSKVPLETYDPPVLTAADVTSRSALGGGTLSPTQNLGDYIQQPPLFLTTIASLPTFLNSQYFQGVPAAERRAPISAIRVKVAGVTGANSQSIARIDSVALRIHELTGLQVDITAGSSPHPLRVDLPAGKFGRPKLELLEGWSKKGVSLSFLHGIDRKQLALFALIPLICCLFLGNGTFAAARSRRAEIGTLLTLGWSRGAIFKLLLGEILFVALAAGLVGVGVAAGLTAILGLKAPLLSTVLVLPTALLLALLSALLPTLRASSGRPLDALRPAVATGRRAGRVNRLAGMAFVNLRRVPARALLGALGLAVGACALTVLVAVERAFDGVLAGTVLGDAISVQIQGFDYLAVGLVIGLAGLSIADVLYLNLRERQAELVTLRTLGWQQSHLARVVVVEALLLGLVASGIGAAAGVAIGLAALSAPAIPVVVGAAAALGGGIVAATLASLIPLSQIGRLTPPSVLAAEQ